MKVSNGDGTSLNRAIATLVLSVVISLNQVALARGDISHDVTWDALEIEKARTKLALSKEIFPEFFDKQAYGKSEFDLQMYLNAAVAESNVSGADSAETMGYLLDFADYLYRRRSKRFAPTVSFVNSKIQLLPIDEQSKVLPKIFSLLLGLCHEEEELGALPLVQTAIELSLNPKVKLDMQNAQSLFAVQRNYTESGYEVAPDGRRDHYVVLLVETASTIFDRLQPLSKDAVTAHERLATLYEGQHLTEAAEKQYLKVVQLNDRHAIGQYERTANLLSLMHIFVASKRYGKAASLYFAHQSLFITPQLAEKISEVVELLLAEQSYQTAIDMGVAIFPHLNWNPIKQIPPKSPTFHGCGFELPYKQWPTTQLRQWLNICIGHGRTDMARTLYNKCALAATKFNKAGTTEYSSLRSVANELNLFQ